MELFEQAVSAVEMETGAIGQRQATESQRIAQATGQDPALFAGGAQPTPEQLGIDTGSLAGELGKSIAAHPQRLLDTPVFRLTPIN